MVMFQLQRARSCFAEMFFSLLFLKLRAREPSGGLLERQHDILAARRE
jgi:hypothetical protein